MEIHYKNDAGYAGIPADEIVVGTVFTAHLSLDPAFPEPVAFLRIAHGMLRLDDPGNVWLWGLGVEMDEEDHSPGGEIRPDFDEEPPMLYNVTVYRTAGIALGRPKVW